MPILDINERTLTILEPFWAASTLNRVKGNNFTIPNLLNVPADSETATYFDDASLAIFRLAPADYHRFHSPIDGEIGEIVDVPGQYYTGALHTGPLVLDILSP